MTLQSVKRKVVTVGDFRFTGRLLGKGNFARVEEAVHNILNVKVAVKIIDLKIVKEKYVVKNLHREAQIMATLNHPCIATLFQTMLSDSVYFLVTELVSGGDLCSFILAQRYGKLDERSARIFARQFASAVCHMHSFGIVHRDLKMENVILNSEQTQIKIVDFGLSNVWSKDNPLRTNCGSPEYAAPEVFVAGREYGPEVDIWSLGIIFYGMVVGQLPFVSGRNNQLSAQDQRKKLIAQVGKGLGATQRQALAPLSPEFRVMLNKLLTANPAKRITINELILNSWFTEKGKKRILAHPLPKLDNDIHAKLIGQISQFAEMRADLVSTEVAKKSFGRLGAMYRILVYKLTIDQFDASNIAMKVMEDKNTCNTETKQKSVVLSKSQRTLYNQWVVLFNQMSKQQTNIKPPGTNATPTTVNNSAQSHHPKTQGLETKSAESRYHFRNVPAIFGNKSSKLAQTSKRAKSSGVGPGNSQVNRKQIISRPTTVENSTNFAKSLKKYSLSAAPTTSVRHKQQELQQVGDGLRSSKKVLNSTNVTFRRFRAKNPLSNDPIARSIATYIVKNVPD